MRESLSVDNRVAITLCCLATPAEYRTIAHIARSTVCHIVHETCNTAATSCVHQILMHGDQLDVVVSKFNRKWGSSSVYWSYNLPLLITIEIIITVKDGTL